MSIRLPGWLNRELVVAVLIPAAIAAALVRVFFPPSERAAPVHIAAAPPAAASRLAHAAAAPAPLRPIVLEGGRMTLGSDPTGPATTRTRPAPPSSIAIPALGVHAPVQPVGPAANGIGVPPLHRAGWYSGGPRPGEPGRAVLIGHLDSPTGPDVFGRVPALKENAEITVTDARGHVHAFRVVGKLEIRKARFPANDVYGPAPRPVLVLITCGGPYIRGFGYRDNVIVYARGVPLARAAPPPHHRAHRSRGHGKRNAPQGRAQRRR